MSICRLITVIMKVMIIMLTAVQKLALTESDAIFLAVVGDFNCSLGSRFYNCFQHLVTDNHLICSDLNRLTDTYTYCSDNGLNTSWIDHILCSKPVDELLSVITVPYEYVSSDHEPLSVCFNNLFTQDSVSCVDNNVGTLTRPTWTKASQVQLMHYSNDIDCLLSGIEIPNCLTRCNEVVTRLIITMIKLSLALA